MTSVSYVTPANVQNLTGTGSADITLTGNSLGNVITANSGNDTLVAGSGTATLIGGAGNDLMIGGSGSNTFAYNLGGGLDTLVTGKGQYAIQLGAGLSLQNAVIRLTTADGQPYPVWERSQHGHEDEHEHDNADRWGEGEGEHGHRKSPITTLTAHLRVLDATGKEQASQGMDFQVTVDRRGNITSPIPSFKLADGSTKTFDDMLVKSDVIDATRIVGPVITGRNDDIIYAGPRNTYVQAGSGNDTIYASRSGTKAYGGGGNDYFVGSRGNDSFVGGTGINVMQGGRGDDMFSAPWAAAAMMGGEGNDTLSGGLGKDFIAGGAGNDIISTGATHNVIAFNEGDGRDTVLASPGAMNTLSLGGGIRYRDLSLSKAGDNLVLRAGEGDAITFKSWYASLANQSVGTLQMIKADGDRDGDGGNHRSSSALYNQKVETFDFTQLVAHFDQARAKNPKLGAWGVMNDLLNEHLGGSNTAALGGDLAFQYGTQGDLSAIGLAGIQGVLKDANFGSKAQALHARAD